MDDREDWECWDFEEDRWNTASREEERGDHAHAHNPEPSMGVDYIRFNPTFILKPAF